MGTTGLFESFLGAIQASLSVLLVMTYGGVAGWLGLLDRKSSKKISKICVQLFLPALLITKVGSQLDLDSVSNYVPIVIWGVVCHIVSFGIGMLAQHGFGMPNWASVAILINNTTSYPLLLIAALQETGILDSLIVGDESSQEAVERAKSYFLVFSTISNCITFAVGPRLLEDTDSWDSEDKEDSSDTEVQSAAANDDDVEASANEQTRLLPNHNSSSRRNHQQQENYTDEHPFFMSQEQWDGLSPRAQWWLSLVLSFFNAPLIGAVIGAVLGLAPPLHKAFFSPTQEGGIFHRLTISQLFAPLPVLVTGLSLFNSIKDFRKDRKQGREDGKLRKIIPWGTVSFILLVRFIIWPAMSIGTIWMLASKTKWLGRDPILWFTMMMMPSGPSAQKLISLVQVTEGVGQEQEGPIARLLTISYIVSPLLSLTIVGSLRACQGVLDG
ncbi:putative transporter [Triangularia setosa]|uniref:Transporter n=1 Tax=Triangularia setosa TaxID=2587417 RepID=A0AAN7A4V2_9PEZI|nr:putative transporter [Podospora setosa]